MKIILNNIIPFRGFRAMNLFGVLFVRKEYGNRVSDRTIRHESIHTSQMRELWYVPFYIWYFVEWFIKLFIYGSKAYDNIRFEREAYANEMDVDYLNNRKRFAFMKYVRNKNNKIESKYENKC